MRTAIGWVIGEFSPSGAPGMCTVGSVTLAKGFHSATREVQGDRKPYEKRRSHYQIGA